MPMFSLMTIDHELQGLQGLQGLQNEGDIHYKGDIHCSVQGRETSHIKTNKTKNDEIRYSLFDFENVWMTTASDFSRTGGVLS